MAPTNKMPNDPRRRGKIAPPEKPILEEPLFAFYCFFALNVISALYAPIQDCDETYNYWEPTHYLRRGFGLQTWEYSPQYAIRSWSYVALHAVVGVLKSFPTMFIEGLSLLFTAKRRSPEVLSTKVAEFYFIRIMLGLICAICQARLFSIICRTLNPRVGMFFLIIMVSSTGMFHASTAYLPSSFAMYLCMLGMSNFMDWTGGPKTNNGILAFGAGAVLGWPFAAALAIPYLVEEFILANVTKDTIVEFCYRVLDGVARTSILMLFQFSVDTFFYRHMELVPLNIVRYNIFSGSNKGPNIYGTEPWHFYFRNLALNFHTWFFLALLALPLLGLQLILKGKSTTFQGTLRGIVFVMPFYIWLIIFSFQPHKEERFMYPMYPALCLNAAFSMHIILSYFGSTDTKTLVGKIPAQLKLVVVSAVIIGSIDLGFLRTLGLVRAYAAPLSIYSPLKRFPDTGAENAVCLGKEWYRFPSSYFLPDHMRARFIKSEFNGLLPGQFNEVKEGFGFWPGTYLEPPGMNDENREDIGKYIDISHCDFLVDSYFPGSEASKVEPHYVLDTEAWEEISCRPFLDASRTGVIGRTLWLPDSRLVPDKYRRKWGRLCLLRRKHKS